MIAILVPVLGRPKRVAPLLKSIAEATSIDHTILFLTDSEDLEEREAIHAAGAGDSEIACGGSYAKKINLGLSSTSEPLIFFAADDLHFHPGWAEAAIAKLEDGIGVVGTNDLGNPRVIAGETATHSLITRAYAALGAIDGGPLLHEGYTHNFVDTELVETARARHAFAFAADSHVEHLHPYWGKGDADETYSRGEHYFHVDRSRYRRRRQLWETSRSA